MTCLSHLYFMTGDVLSGLEKTWAAKIFQTRNLLIRCARKPAAGGTINVIAYRVSAVFGSIKAISTGRRATDHKDQAVMKLTVAPSPAPALIKPAMIGNIT